MADDAAKSSKTETQESAEEDLKKLAIAEREDSKNVKLVTSDNIIFVVESFIAKEMETVQAFIDACGDDETVVIPLPNVTGRDLSRILDYCSMHFRENASASNLKDFDERFVKDLSNDELKELLIAANYLNIKMLLEFLSRCIANAIKHKDVEYVRAFFGVVNDYTEEEEAQYRRENAWAFENIDKD
ncbi:SKP1-like protein 4, partial [Mucuna pruriens]